MPKIKTSKGALKRLKVTGSGKLRRNRAGKSHLLTGKPTRRTRALRKPGLISPADARRMRRLVPYL